MPTTLPEDQLGTLDLDPIEKALAEALKAGTPYVLPTRLALRIVRTAQTALADAGETLADHISDGDWILDLTYRLRNVRRALRNATKVRVPKRLAAEPAVLRLKAIARRALEWDDDHEAEMIAEFGSGIERAGACDDVCEDFDASIPEVGQVFADRWGSTYRVVGYYDDESLVDVELVEATKSIPLADYLSFMYPTREEIDRRCKAANDARDAKERRT